PWVETHGSTLKRAPQLPSGIIVFSGIMTLATLRATLQEPAHPDHRRALLAPPLRHAPVSRRKEVLPHGAGCAGARRNAAAHRPATGGHRAGPWVGGIGRRGL